MNRNADGVGVVRSDIDGDARGGRFVKRFHSVLNQIDEDLLQSDAVGCDADIGVRAV
ncbi:hypothetical protein D3C80_2112990 [compost metagenome]